MKFVFCLLVLLPFALSEPLTAEEVEVYRRFILGDFTAKQLGQKILDFLGSDTSEAACEAACPTALSALAPGAGGLLAGTLCGPACHWVQNHLG